MKRNINSEDASFKLYTVLTKRLIHRQIEETVLNGNIADLFPEYKEERLRQEKNVVLIQGIVSLVIAIFVTLSIGIGFIPKIFNPLNMSWVYGVTFLTALPFYVVCIFLCFTSRSIKGYMPRLHLASAIICFSAMGLLTIGFVISVITS